MSVTRVEKMSFWGFDLRTVEKSSTPDLHWDQLRPETKQHKETLEKNECLAAEIQTTIKRSFLPIKTDVEAELWDKNRLLNRKKDGEPSPDMTLTSDKSRNALERVGLGIYSSDVFRVIRVRALAVVRFFLHKMESMITRSSRNDLLLCVQGRAHPPLRFPVILRAFYAKIIINLLEFFK